MFQITIMGIDKPYEKCGPMKNLAVSPCILFYIAITIIGGAVVPN